MELLSSSIDQTHAFAKDLAKELKGGEVLLFEGDLGSGKTEFIRGLVFALGYKDVVRSPTFTLVNSYPLEEGEIKFVHHLDLYRIKEVSELPNLGIEDLLTRDAVVCVEWPELFPKNDLVVFFVIKCSVENEQTRKITIQKYER